MTPFTTTTLEKRSTITIEDVVRMARERNPGADLPLIRQAYEFAEAAHRGQTRETGEPYIIHPVHVAYTIAQLRLGTTAIMAALLHDVREDTSPAYSEQIARRFGEATNFLVQGVTKLSKVRKLRENTGSIEDLRTIFLAMSRDIRVIIIKLADRLHNLQTLSGLDTERRLRISRQTLDIYSPIADRLGMGDIKGQLEDLAFDYALPEQATLVRSLVKDAYTERARYCETLRQAVTQELRRNAIPVIDVHGRAKRLYSLYLKLQRYNNDINQIYDLVAVRVVVPTIEDCYKALGVVHRRWRPLVGKIKDYVATPKANGYQSLHTTVITDEGKFVEVQIRTNSMHERAERGIAASWSYAEAKRQDPGALAAALADEHDITWVKQLAHWQQDIDTPEEFFQTLRSDFFKNRIFCLTPKGEVINLPEGGTPIDFAYCIRRSLGNRAVDARVNGVRRPLDYALGNGDVVYIELGPESHTPKREWLDFVKTNNARHGIKQWYAHLSAEHAVTTGRTLLAKELHELLGRSIESLQAQEVREYLSQHGYRTMDELYAAVGKGERNPRQVVKRIFAEDRIDLTVPVKRQLNVKIEGQLHPQAVRARCCRPIEGDAIVGVRHGARVLVHRTECHTLHGIPLLQRLKAAWILDAARTYRVWIEVQVTTYTGMLRDIADVCAQGAIPIHDIVVRRRPTEISSVSILAEIKDADQLSMLIRKLHSLPKVTVVHRRHS
ncbi:MAG: RelA/SpoT family protein [Candidatus Andersenbacteria bacterium]